MQNFYVLLYNTLDILSIGNRSDGDSAGHTLVHSHTGSIADVDITQSGIYDNLINLTTSGDNADIDISQTD